MKKKIFFFTSGAVGGAERVGVTISKILVKNGFVIKFVIIGSQDSPINDLIPKGIERYHISKNYMRWHKIGALIKSDMPDVVFAPCRSISRDIIGVTKIWGIKSKVVVRSDNPLKTLKLWQRILVKLSFRYADVVIAQQEEMAQEIINEYPIPAERVVTLLNPIDEDFIREKSQAPSPYTNNDEIRFVWVARISETGTKGHDVLIEAFSEVHQCIPNAHLYFVGRFDNNGVFYNKCQRLIKIYQLSDYIHFVGYDSNPYRWVKHADCFVLPSRVEGLPNALVEAMFLGKPTVATQCLPIIDRMIRDGYNGYKVPVEDVNALSNAMKKAILLKDFKMIYHPTDKDEIVKVFS